MISKKSTFLFVFALALCSCHKEETKHEEISSDNVVRFADQPADFMIPSKLWDLLLPRDKGGGQKYKSENDEETMGASVLFAPFTVILEEKNSGILERPQIRFEFTKGGGVIDLARYLTGKAGTFFVRFEAEGLSDPNTLRAFFLSKAKKRKVAERFVGSGCHRFFDVTKAILANVAGKGFAVNTTRNFASSTLGGHFLLSWQREGLYYVAQAHFTDSSHPQLFCNSTEAAQ